MNQLLLGLAVPYLLSAVIYAARRCRASVRMLVFCPLFMLGGSLWAVAPDIPRLLGMNGLYDRLSRDPRCDIFLWHYSIDQSETASAWFTALFVLVLASLLAVAWRELLIKEQGMS